MENISYQDGSIEEISLDPLVSIIIITYNSSQYVLETLKSAYEQTYRNIELILTDDGSSDDTVEICKKWIEKKRNRFVRTELLTVDKNTGIAPNCNRGLYASKGKWIKIIAGDDILLDNCISSNLSLVNDYNNSFYFSKMRFTENSELSLVFQRGFELFMKESNQLKILLKGNCLPAPTSFIKREALIELSGFDERFPMVEDYPLWIKAIKNNYRITFANVETVVYRISSPTENNQRSNNQVSNNLPFTRSMINFEQKILLWEQLKNGFLLLAWNSLIRAIKFKIAMLSIKES